MKSKRSLFFAALIVPVVLLLSLTWKPLFALNAGETILLETIPVDPRDILYGDYVSLRFEIEDVPEQLIEPHLLEKFPRDSYAEYTVFALLEEKEGGIYGLQTVQEKKPAGGIFLKGKLYSYGDSYMNVGGSKIYYANFLPDRFYVPENTGKRLEELSAQGRLIAEMKIHNGYALLRDIRQK